MELSLNCQTELEQVRGDLVQIRKDIEAVRRKVYRDLENTAAGGLVEVQPGDLRNTGAQVNRTWRTGDPI